MENKNMPSKGGHLALVILGFLIGILWGVLAIFPYRKMTAAINDGDVETAQANAKKVRLYFFVGLALNVVLFIARVALKI